MSGAVIRFVAIATILLSVSVPVSAGHKALEADAFEVNHELVLPGTPEEVFDAVTGDISGWWDHTISENAVRLFIEPRAGGGFWEIFDDDGNGVRHAEVTLAWRGKLLRFEGPLGLTGNAIHMVHTYEFSQVAESDAPMTRLVLTVRASGQMEEGWAKVVDDVWAHFLFEQLKPWVEGGGHRGG